ncbi:MAG: glutamate--tRNA ligase [Chitinophagaceae bacterium]
MENKVRVRFAPSPTGGLHLGGVRTVLYNYLFAKKYGGDFIVRIEDTDQTRFVEGAEEYIFKTLEWCGLQPNESVLHGGPFAPYRQSERKAMYKQYALQLVEKGLAYYAFDTPEELDEQRKNTPNFQYSSSTRNGLKNSITLSETEVQALLGNNTPYVIRVKMQPNKVVELNDLIRGFVSFDTTQVDDKVLLKADGMPTYHLAVVVDDFLMKITHAFRGEEWLPSAPVHVFLWEHLFGLENMPKWAHLPLILKPDGNGKLSKRDGDRLGFPVFAMDWQDPRTNEKTIGFKERGFLPEAFVNMLAMLGWNDGSEQEIFTIEELVEKFSLERVHKGGAKFDYEKAKHFNKEWIKKLNIEDLILKIEPLLVENNIDIEDKNKLQTVVGLVKDRCTFLNDFVEQMQYFYKTPAQFDIASIQPKWDDNKKEFFKNFIDQLPQINWQPQEAETAFKALAAQNNIKVGEVMMPLRIMLVGGKFGPGVFDIACLLSKEEVAHRVNLVLNQLV